MSYFSTASSLLNEGSGMALDGASIAGSFAMSGLRTINGEAVKYRRDTIQDAQLNANPFKQADKGMFGRRLMPQEKWYHNLEGKIHNGKQIGFSGRTSGQHLKMGFYRAGQELPFGMIGAVAQLTNLGFEVATSSGNELLDIRSSDGSSRRLVGNAAAGLGWGVGSGIGAAIGTAIPLPFTGALGYLAGGLAGTVAGYAGAGIPWSLGDYGRKLRAPPGSQAINSRNAITMRQRALQMIYQSNLNARSALGMEASAWHS